MDSRGGEKDEKGNGNRCTKVKKDGDGSGGGRDERRNGTVIEER